MNPELDAAGHRSRLMEAANNYRRTHPEQTQQTSQVKVALPMNRLWKWLRQLGVSNESAKQSFQDCLANDSNS